MCPGRQQVSVLRQRAVTPDVIVVSHGTEPAAYMVALQLLSRVVVGAARRAAMYDDVSKRSHDFGSTLAQDGELFGGKRV